jgi:predicted acetyltransferase
VSMMMLLRRPLRIGTAVVNGAIIAPVATHPNHQGKKYCSAVMRDAVRYMKTQRFDITILWGNTWLYPHYGYSPAMVKTELVIKPTQKKANVKNHSKLDHSWQPMQNRFHGFTTITQLPEHALKFDPQQCGNGGPVAQKSNLKSLRMQRGK